jgi:hypothetical protein
MNSLERHTLVQTSTITDLRFTEVMEDFARIANDESALPIYASIYAGTVILTDTASLGATTDWQHAVGMNGFASQNANPALNRQSAQNWTIDPIVDPEKLEAMRCAFNWVIRGRERVTSDCLALLARPDQVPQAPGRHFGVLDRLHGLPPGWLCTGRIGDVPVHAAYKSHHGNTWVWVMPEGIQGLADFSLIVQDIARVNINATTLFNPNPIPSQLSLNVTGGQVIVAVNGDGKLAPDAQYFRVRVDSQGSDAFFRSTVTAVGSTK